MPPLILVHACCVQIYKLWPCIVVGVVKDYTRVQTNPISDFSNSSLRAASLKTVNVLLQAGITLGLLPPVTSLVRRVTLTRLGKTDEQGLTLLHHASAHACPDVISALMIAGCDIHQPTSTPDGDHAHHGHTPPPRTQAIHLAAATGDVDSLCCLIHYGADLCTLDGRGWAPIHHASFNNCHMAIRHLAELNPLLMEMETGDHAHATPLLLAARNGCFDSFQMLVEMGADLGRTTSDPATSGCNVVHLAALRHHAPLLRYLVELGDKRADVWHTLSQMLASTDHTLAGVAARNLDPLTRWRPEHHAPRLLEEGGVASLVQLLAGDETLQLLSLQVLANISDNEGVKTSLVDTDIIPKLVALLTSSSSSDRIHANVCLVLSDLGVVPAYREAIARAGGVAPLVGLLGSEVDDVQLFSCACVGILARESPGNQTNLCRADALPALVSLLQSPLPCVQESATHALRLVLTGNRANQLSALAEKVVPPLVVLLRSKDPSVHSSAARTVQALATNCSECQLELLSDLTCINLLKRLLKMRDPEVKVCGGVALWAIAGSLVSNQRLIATHMGLELLVDMLTIHNPKLDYVCSEALGALATELGDNQDRIIRVGGVKPLVEALTTPTTSQEVQLSVIHTLSALCMKPALVPNPASQTAVGGARGVVILASLVSDEGAGEEVRVEAACTLAKLVLEHPKNDRILSRHTNFSFVTIFRFFASSDAKVRLLAGYCLSVMCFNNPAKLEEMRQCGSLNVSNFTPFLCSLDQFYQVRDRALLKLH